MFFLLLPPLSLLLVRFLTSLISAAPDRLGKNGVGEVMASTWLAGVPWERIREMRAPYVTDGAARVKVRATLCIDAPLFFVCILCVHGLSYILARQKCFER